jgi:hypothetical protein
MKENRKSSEGCSAVLDDLSSVIKFLWDTIVKTNQGGGCPGGRLSFGVPDEIFSFHLVRVVEDRILHLGRVIRVCILLNKIGDA